jgi:hypothetical protein
MTAEQGHIVLQKCIQMLHHENLKYISKYS